MRVLFVCSGNSKKFFINPFIAAQADSLVESGVEIKYFLVKGKGLWGYLKHVFPLRKLLLNEDIDVIHAHYSLTGIVASLASLRIFGCRGKKVPIVVSLMGSDVMGAGWWLCIIRFFVRIAWDVTVVKSLDMKRSLGMESPVVIPNGVNLHVFKPMPASECRQRLGLGLECRIILFGSDPGRKVKNYTLAKEAVAGVALEQCKLLTLGSVPHDEIPLYLNACDVLLLTSRWEGSPNIVKEAMACGTPVVCTDVGDVRWLLEGLEGCYITDQYPADISNKLIMAIDFQGKTRGRDRLKRLGIDSISIAERLIAIYGQ